MIPMMHIVAWGKTVPWTEVRQIEQDLVICRARVELFRDDFLREQVRFRGGTALNKLQRKSTIFSETFRPLCRLRSRQSVANLSPPRATTRRLALPA